MRLVPDETATFSSRTRTSTNGAVFICPGQGVQYPGLLDPWLTSASTNDLCDRWSEALELDLRAASRDRDALRNTAVVQPLITAVSLLSYETLSRTVRIDCGESCVIGHSVGELAAAAIAGFITFETAVTLARARGNHMATCCADQPTGMLVLMPARKNPASPEEILSLASSSPHVSVANVNGGGQVVVAGRMSALEEFELALDSTVRAVYLEVAGAFHSKYMEPGRAAFAVDLSEARFSERPVNCPVFFSNRDGRAVQSGADIKDRLTSQIVQPVRWDLCMSAASRTFGASPVVELAPGNSYAKLWARQHNSPAGAPIVSLDGDFDSVASVF